MRSVGIQEVRWTSRTPFGGGGACALVQHAAAAVASGAADAVVVYRAFNERSGRRFGQPNAADRSPPRAGTGTCRTASTRRPRCTRCGSSATWTRYGLDQRRLRALHRRRPQVRGHQPERLVLQAADHPRGPPELAVDRRADPAAARLLPGERRRRGPGRHQRRAGAGPAPAARHDRGGRPRATSSSGDTMFNYYAPTPPASREAEYVARQLWADSRPRAGRTSTSR